jgi:hypothetical protein
MGSFMLLGVTNHITHDVASVPFLWILPLTLYLVTFILCFEGRGWYQRHIFLGPLLVVVGAMAWALNSHGGIQDIKEAVPLYSVGLFVCCMFFHGELANLKPPSSDDLLSDESLGARQRLIGFVAPGAAPTMNSASRAGRGAAAAWLAADRAVFRNCSWDFRPQKDPVIAALIMAVEVRRLRLRVHPRCRCARHDPQLRHAAGRTSATKKATTACVG